MVSIGIKLNYTGKKKESIRVRYNGGVELRRKKKTWSCRMCKQYHYDVILVLCVVNVEPEGNKT